MIAARREISMCLAISTRLAVTGNPVALRLFCSAVSSGTPANLQASSRVLPPEIARSKTSHRLVIRARRHLPVRAQSGRQREASAALHEAKRLPSSAVRTRESSRSHIDMRAKNRRPDATLLVTAASPDCESTASDLKDRGSGELGRLKTEYERRATRIREGCARPPGPCCRRQHMRIERFGTQSGSRPSHSRDRQSYRHGMRVSG